MKQKFTYISNARIIGILLVVFGHSYPFEIILPTALITLRSFIYCFHMPLFVLISGYLVTKTNSIKRHGKKQYLLQRFLRLLIPYLGLTLLGYIPKIFVSNFINDEVEFNLFYFIRTFFVPRENVWGHFWFLPMIFIMAVISIVYTDFLMPKRTLMIIVLAMTFGIMFLPGITDLFSLNDLKNYLFWYLFGMFLGQKNEDIKAEKWYIIIYFLGAIVAFVVGGMRAYNPIVASFMIGGIFAIATQFNFEKYKLLKEIDAKSFSIFLLSWPVQAIVEVIFNRMLHLPILVTIVSMFVCGVTIPLLIIRIVEQFRRTKIIRGLELLIGI